MSGLKPGGTETSLECSCNRVQRPSATLGSHEAACGKWQTYSARQAREECRPAGTDFPEADISSSDRPTEIWLVRESRLARGIMRPIRSANSRMKNSHCKGRDVTTQQLATLDSSVRAGVDVLMCRASGHALLGGPTGGPARVSLGRWWRPSGVQMHTTSPQISPSGCWMQRHRPCATHLGK